MDASGSRAAADLDPSAAEITTTVRELAPVPPAHLDGPGGAEITRDGDRFAIKAWAPFDRR